MKYRGTVISACAVLSFNTLPVFAQEDFSTHNRFVFGKNRYPLEKDKVLPVHDIPHAVRAGEVSVPLVTIDSLLPATPAPPAATTNSCPFGKPRPLPTTTGVTPYQNPTPFVTISQRAPIAAAKIEPQIAEHPRIQASSPVPCATASKVHAHTVVRAKLQPPAAHVPVIPQSYPSEHGYSYGSPTATSSSDSTHHMEVRGKILRSH